MMKMELEENKKMQEKTPQIVNTHRTGTITFGLTLIFFGVLFLVHMVFPVLDYVRIFRLWPCILILLGVEVLLANRKENIRFVYDRGAIVLLILMMLFAMMMAGIDILYAHGATYISF